MGRTGHVPVASDNQPVRDTGEYRDSEPSESPHPGVQRGHLMDRDGLAPAVNKRGAHGYRRVRLIADAMRTHC